MKTMIKTTGFLVRSCSLPPRPALAASACSSRTARRRPRRRGHRRAQLSHGGWPRGAACRHRNGGETRSPRDTVGACRRPRCDVARRERRPGPLRPPAGFRVCGSGRHVRCKASCSRAVKRWFRGMSPTRHAPRNSSPPRPSPGRPGAAFGPDPAVIKNAESPGDILARIGQFTVVEGKVLSVRQAGATFYLNFGRRWTRDFAVTISRRVVPSFEAAGIVLKSLENKRIRVRGCIESRGGPRIEARTLGQIELAGEN